MEKERDDARGNGVSLFSHSDRVGDDLGKDDDASEKSDDGRVVAKTSPEIVHGVGVQLNH